MRCDEIDRRLTEGESPVALEAEAEIRAHMDLCLPCRSVLTWMNSTSPETPGHPWVDARIRELIKADLKPVRPLPPNGVLVAFMAVIAIALIVAFGGIMGWQGLGAMTSLQVAVFSLWGVPVAAGLIVSLAWSIRPGAAWRVHPGVPVTALVLGYPVLVMTLFPWRASPHVLTDGLRCFGAGALVSLAAASVTMILVRRGYSLNDKLTGAILGGLAGLIAAVALQVVCPQQQFLHLALWHGLTIVTSVGACTVFARQLTGS